MIHNFLIIILSLSFSISVFAESAKDCSGLNHPNYEDEYRACLRVQIATKASDAGVDCVDCLFAKEEKGPSAWVEALSAIAGPLAYLGGAYVTAKYQYQSQEAWANAYADGPKQCTSRFNSYLDYSTTMGANPVTTDEARGMMNACNGSSYNQYSGMSGYSGNSYGGFANPWSGAGYSSGFMSGMIGPNFGGMNSQYGANYGIGLGTGIYSGMNNNLYGNAGYGMYGNVGIGMSPYTMSYGSNYSGMNGSSMGYAGMGMNTMYTSGISNYGSNAYGAGNLSASVGISATSGFAF